MTEIVKQEEIDHLYLDTNSVITVNELKHSTSTLSISSSSSSSSSDDDDAEYKSMDNDMTTLCSCTQILVSRDSEHCGLCDHPLPLITTCQQDRDQTYHRLHDMQSQLEETRLSLQLVTDEHTARATQYDKHQQELTEMTNKIHKLTEDIEIVQSKHKDEIAHTKQIEISKNLVENELHDLTTKLFEEVDQMVLVEKQQKLEIQQQHDVVEAALQKAEQEMSMVQKELQELRKNMAEQVSTEEVQPEKKLTRENYVLRAQLDMATLQETTQPVRIHQPFQDGLLLTEFDWFMEILPSTTLSKLGTLPFMKLCIKSDIEPCLRFGTNPRISSKKIMDAILVKTCLVESCTSEFLQEKLSAAQQSEAPKARLWNRFSASPAGSGIIYCQACHRALFDDCYRFRISYFDEWSLIDRYCYDRIASVMAFYGFVRKLKAGHYRSRDAKEVYEECSRLLLQMFLSRMGALPTLLDEFGLDSRKIGSASQGTPL